MEKGKALDFAALEAGWTSELLTDEEVLELVDHTVWPSINYLFDEETGRGDFLANAHEREFFGQKTAVTNPNGIEALIVKFGAFSGLKPFDHESMVATSRQFKANVMIIEKEDPISEAQSGVAVHFMAVKPQIWFRYSYTFDPMADDMVRVDITRFQKKESSEHEVLLNGPSDQHHRTVISREDVMRVATAFLILGAPDYLVNQATINRYRD